MPRQQLLEKSK